jgi:diguanylate cyclase (GGDEF)-like protein
MFNLSRRKLLHGGIAILFFVLAGCIITTAFATYATGESIQSIQYLSDQIGQARYWIATEESFEREYRLKPDQETRDSYQKAATQLIDTLQNAIAASDKSDRATLNSLLAMHGQYQVALQDVFAAIDTGSAEKANQIEESRADPQFKKIESAIKAQADTYHNQVDQQLLNLHHVQEGTIVIVLIGFVCVSVLAIFLWRTFRGYQSQLEEARQQEELRLKNAALLDTLTNLGNHRAYHEDAQREVMRAHLHGIPLCLALIDIDDFASMNATCGHAYGDQVLTSLGDLLPRLIGNGKAYRLGGDEFAILLPHTTKSAAYTMLEGIRQMAIAHLQGTTLSLGLVALTPDVDPDMFQEQADAALSEAKRRGRNVIVSYEDIRNSVTVISLQKAQALRDILTAGHMNVVFQPIWNINTRELLAVEALSRPDSSFGFRGPQEMFDVAERIGHEAELDLLCVQSALETAHTFPSPPYIFVNLCPRSLGSSLFKGDALRELVERTGFRPEQVVLEMTERNIAGLDELLAEIDALRAEGFRIALDDTGAGNSGLEMLTHMRVDFVKIDRGILVKAMHDKAARGVLAGVMAITCEIGSNIIAEGIETLDMLELIQQLESDYSIDIHDHILGVQGYLFGRPSPTMPGDFPEDVFEEKGPQQQVA